MVFFAYRFCIHLALLLLAPFTRFHTRLKELIEGWRESNKALCAFEADPSRPLWWFHCASLGEFEQAVPVMVRSHTSLKMTCKWLHFSFDRRMTALDAAAAVQEGVLRRRFIADRSHRYSAAARAFVPINV